MPEGSIDQRKTVFTQKNGIVGGKDFYPGNPGHRVSLNLPEIQTRRSIPEVYATNKPVTWSCNKRHILNEIVVFYAQQT